ncbi:uncharacterized protein PHACADRAFT_246918 [Phanerochaete carnosa HHB-10118-sp]|uniref:OPT oligopeptide transporter n=1 Tax=Phanerochaete carnosa (strain HHB-10118-sp) TaxID=650164 RepID=K5XCS8_PHACS|nr:uncharacterized protein PHACADRAFT_246918 [Phanerochaete carnosa HHB-10118-sp]EKM60787.1 hypothetical protein PHACADRAFT_246918 [Phanerochaete carnosa HHB-10118-sp]
MSTALASSLAALRRTVPDVPEDIDDVLEHLNDPNWDYRPPSPTLSTESIDLDPKEKGFISSRHSGSDYETESNAESTYGKTAVTSTYGKTEQSHSHLWSSAASDLDDDSPYPEVRAAVSNVDDPSMPVNTFRAWFLGLVFAIAATSLNTFMSLRAQIWTFSPLVAQILVMPFGKFLAWALPTTQYRTFGYTWSLNPGPFNVKEHTLIVAMVSMCWQTVYMSSVYITQEVNYGQELSYSYKILTALSNQLIGMGIGGMFRSFLVWPSSMIYPGTLVSCSLMNTLHRTWGKRERKHISRHKLFAIVCVASALWYLIPGFVFTGVSIFSWACWIAPTNPTVNVVFGSLSGMGMGLLTFDWSMIILPSGANSLVSPWWAQINVYVTFVIVCWIIAPILYFKNVVFAQYMPISIVTPFDNTGMPYDVTQVMNNGTFDADLYHAYSPLFLSSTNVLAYTMCFAIFPATIVHTILWYSRDIRRQFSSSLSDNRDVHSRLMLAYPEVPMWWYGLLFALCFVAGCIGIEIFPTEFPIWALVVSLLITTALVIPLGIIRAVTNQWLAMTYLAEILGGYVTPGKPVAFMLFKSYLGAAQEISSTYLTVLKLGHYMKVPPRTMFAGTLASVFVTTFISQGIVDAVLNNNVDACTPLSPNGFTCADNQDFVSSAVIWGAIGSKRIFGPGGLYRSFLWIILVCSLLPVPFYLLARRYPYSRWRYVNIPAALSAAMFFPPCTGMQFTSWFVIGGVFQGFLRRRHFRWWMRYNYVLAAALDAGLAFGSLLVFVCFFVPKGGNLTFDWWGNTVWQNTNDAMGAPFKMPPVNQTFGPTTWA